MGCHGVLSMTPLIIDSDFSVSENFKDVATGYERLQSNVGSRGWTFFLTDLWALGPPPPAPLSVCGLEA
jgi:hypothetical protein